MDTEKKNVSWEDTHLESNKWKVQYVPVLNQVPCHEGIGDGCLATFILNLKSRGR